MSDKYSSTPNYGLPYPTEDAPVDTAGDLQRLAEAVDATEFSGGGIESCFLTYEDFKKCVSDRNRFTSNKPLSWAELPAYGQEDNGSLTLRGMDDSTFTYTAQFKWDNTGQLDLSWLLDVTQFQDFTIQTGAFAFAGITATRLTGLEHLDTSELTDMTSMFEGASNFNQALSSFDTSKVLSMSSMFKGAASFNQSLSNFDTSKVTDMASMFAGASDFNQSLTGFDISKVTDVSSMFAGAASFNQLLDDWKVGQVTTMESMFEGASRYNRPMSFWDVSQVTKMDKMFAQATNFDQRLGSWCVDQIPAEPTSFADGSALKESNRPCWGECGCPVEGPDVTTFIVNQPGLSWEDLPAYNQPDNGSLTLVSDNGDGTYTYSADFEWDNRPVGAEFIDPLNPEDTPLQDPKALGWLDDVLGFKGNRIRSGWAAFNAFNGTEITALPDLDTSELTHMQFMFSYATNFNQRLDNFDTSNVVNTSKMFMGAYKFNQPLNHFKMGKVVTTTGMFYQSREFNQPLDNWDVSNVVHMEGMFYYAQFFDGSLAGWDTSSVKHMGNMFYNAQSFNQPLNHFNTSNVIGMFCMFNAASEFNQPLDNWDTSKVVPVYQDTIWFKSQGMIGMFNEAYKFDQDLSSWCVSQMSQKPWAFDGKTPLSLNSAHQPKWSQAC